MAEVDGNCTPSYYDAHKIIVKVYAGAYASGTPISENDSYITATNGHMLTENSKFYPQCIRGKFSFLLPLFNPSSPATILTAVLVQFYIQASDAKKGEVTSPVASSTITILP